jgi:hypothetical protein
MRKAIDPLDLREPVARRPSLGLVAGVIALVLLVPVALELAGLVANQWRGMMGPVEVVETPALDLMLAVRDEIWRVARSGLGTIGRRREYLIATLLVCVGVGAFVLRKAP